MKNKRTLLFAAFISATIGNTFAQSYEFANFNRYAESNQELSEPGKKEKRIIFMGNSITEGWVNKRPDFFIENKYIGRGISGQTSYQFLLRFREDVINLHPKLVIINAGTNDIAENTGKYVEKYTLNNIISMVELAKANKIKVILTSVLPASKFNWNKSITDAPKKIQSLNEKLRQYAKKNHIYFVDYFPSLVDTDGQSLKASYSKDGVHPTIDGYKVMEKIIKKAIDEVL